MSDEHMDIGKALVVLMDTYASPAEVRQAAHAFAARYSVLEAELAEAQAVIRVLACRLVAHRIYASDESHAITWSASHEESAGAHIASARAAIEEADHER